jgi:hypothetical protein
MSQLLATYHPSTRLQNLQIATDLAIRHVSVAPIGGVAWPPRSRRSALAIVWPTTHSGYIPCRGPSELAWREEMER